MLTQSTWQHYNAATGEGTGTPTLTRWIYDPATGQLAQKQHADGKGPSCGYTPGGRLASRTWARGTSTTYVYDDAGMMRSLDHSDSTPDVAFSYTRTGQLDTVQDGALSGSGIATPRFTHSYTYSSIGQLTTESSTTTVGRTLTRVYEIDGTVPGRSIGWDLHTPDDPADAPSHWQRYGFDGAGRLNAVSSPAGEYSYTYVDQSHLLASVTGPVHSVSNSYESGRDAMTSKTNAAASGTVSRFGAKYDALGRRIETSRSGSAFAQNFVSGYQYDLLGQLTKDERFAGETPGDPAAKLEAQSFGFLFDGIGNRLTARKGSDTTAYTPNALNQYTDIDGVEPVYDADGNLFSDGKNRYHWDAENRLTLVEPLVATEGSKRLEFKYDYIGRRVSKQVWTHTGGAWTDESTTAFVYDSWNLIEEIATSSQTASINHYTWGLDLSLSLQGAGGVGGLLSVVCAPSTESGLIGDWLLPIGYVSLAPSTFHYTFDLNGNVSEVLDSTGSIAAHYEYGPFGELTHEFHSSNSHLSLLTFNFSTKYYDTELNTLYYGYRYYDPSTGRWFNRDPMEESGGLNLYGFVGNDAVNRWDLWGMNYGPPLFPYYGPEVVHYDDPADSAMDEALVRMFLGTKNPSINCGPEHPWTKEMMRHEHLDSIRAMIREQISSHCGGSDSGVIGQRFPASFDLNKKTFLANARIYIRDIMAGLQLISSAYSMGGFSMSYVIDDIDCLKCSADVSFDASDALRLGSLTRVPKTNKSVLQFIALAGIASYPPGMPMTKLQFDAYNHILSMDSSDFDEPFGPNSPLNTVNLSWSWSETVGANSE